MLTGKESRYRVFGSGAFAGNPMTLHEVSHLGDTPQLLQLARQSWSEDNVFFARRPQGAIAARFFSSHGELLVCGHGLVALAQHVFARDGAGSREVQSPHGTWTIKGGPRGPTVVLPAFEGEAINDNTHWMGKALSRLLGFEPNALHAFPHGVWVATLADLAQLRRIKAATIGALRTDTEIPGALIAVVPMRGGYGFRYFAPWHGKQEDSGTGSAHCYLAPLMLGTSGSGRARQFSREGSAEMRVALRDGEVWLSGAVRAVPGASRRRRAMATSAAFHRRAP